MSSTLNGESANESGSAPGGAGGAGPVDLLGYDDYLDDEGDEEGDDYGGLGDLEDSSPGDYEGGNGPLDGLGVLGGPLEGTSAGGGGMSVVETGGGGAVVSLSLGAAAGAGLQFTTLSSTWDPSCCADWDQEKPTEQCYLRIKRDIMSIYNEPPPGMFIVPDVDNMTTLHALITGPFDTPYEGGFFYFLIRCPPDYPIRPPRLRLMSTGGGKVRFNPNLYKNGKVCLSILGTWSGPAWSPALSLSSLLMSIQSLMNEKPYHNEPGFEQERASGDAQRYNEIIRHETLRVAVCDMLEGLTPCPPSLREVMEKSFHECYAHYDATCRAHAHLSGQPMHDPFGERRGAFDYAAIVRRLEALRLKLSASIQCTDGELSDDTSASDDISDDG